MESLNKFGKVLVPGMACLILATKWCYTFHLYESWPTILWPKLARLGLRIVWKTYFFVRPVFRVRWDLPSMVWW